MSKSAPYFLSLRGLCVMLCAIRYHLLSLENLKNIYRGVLVNRVLEC